MKIKETILIIAISGAVTFGLNYYFTLNSKVVKNDTQQITDLQNEINSLKSKLTELATNVASNAKETKRDNSDIYLEGMSELVNDMSQMLDSSGLTTIATNEASGRVMQRVVDDYANRMKIEEYTAKMGKIAAEQSADDGQRYGKEFSDLADSAGRFWGNNPANASNRNELIKKYPESYAAFNAMSINLMMELSTNNIDAAVKWYDVMLNSRYNEAVSQANTKTLLSAQYMLANSLIEADRTSEAWDIISILEDNSDDMVLSMNVGRNRRGGRQQQMPFGQNRRPIQTAAEAAKILKEKIDNL